MNKERSWTQNQLDFTGGAVARVVYLAYDRPDLDVVAREMAKTMANPRVRRT